MNTLQRFEPVQVSYVHIWLKNRLADIEKNPLSIRDGEHLLEV